LQYLREKDALIIADIKRGDIAATASQYAKAHFTGDFEADFITLSPYMGMDSIEPYLPYMKEGKKGVFVLVRTSNKGAEDFENLDIVGGKKLFNSVGDRLTEMGQEVKGKYGYTQIGGVIGCTHVEEGKEIRSRYNDMFFLIPGYGAQGGKAEDVALYLNNGNGGVVNSSRGILLAYKKENREMDFAACAREEAIKMRDEIRRAVESK
ncbi:orotidine-5'-phosphate decarboxylase, partial [Clostridium saudiense]|nr:orotidine-5'-phosphate decarboxylase [Clostridium saudiense]